MKAGQTASRPGIEQTQTSLASLHCGLSQVPLSGPIINLGLILTPFLSNTSLQEASKALGWWWWGLHIVLPSHLTLQIPPAARHVRLRLFGLVPPTHPCELHRGTGI